MYILSGYFDFGFYVLYLIALFLIFQTVRTVDIRIKLDKASKNSDRSLRLRVANSLYDIGSVYRDEGNYQEALKYHQEAYNIRKSYLFDPNNSLLVESEMAVKELELKLGFLQTL